MSSGTKLGRYEIRSKIGEGGMGEVYLAQDTKLDRKVALKILPADVAAHLDRMKRFVQEAKSASALNHPNIITIHEIDQTDSIHFIATEFIDGETLRERMRNAPMKFGEVLDVAAQIASALAAAHAAGIVHRDIKPENIMLRRDGIVKVLDFGLAKLTGRLTPDSIDTEALTRPVVNTDQGVVMGTAIYMSPEQARGLQVDDRTDIFSLGVLIYEIIAKRLPFEGSSTNEIVASILSEKEPQPLARYAREVPTELERIVAKALRKNRDERYQTIKDLLLDLKSLKQELEFSAKLEQSAPPAAGSKASSPPTEPAEAATSYRPAAPSTGSVARLTSQLTKNRGLAVLAAIAMVVVAVTLVYFSSAYFKTNQSINSLAVLPLVNASNDPNTEYLSDGITESIINSLSQLPNLKVMARTTVFRYKGKETDAQRVGKELGVEAVLTGKVLQRGDTLVIQADLVKVSDGSQLWGEQYTRKMSDIFAVQGEIAKEISERLKLRLTGPEQTRLTKHPTENAEAYELYLKGYHYVYKFDEEDIKKGIEYFKQAIEKDPNYAAAYAGLSEAYFQASGYMDPAEAGPKAKEAAQRALAIDPTVADAHYALGLVGLNERDWLTAERELQRAIKLKPSYALAHDWYGWILAMMGRFDESFVELKRGLELDPLSLAINADLGQSYYWARRYDQSVEQLWKTLELDPSFTPAICNLAMTYAAQGQYQKAVAELNKIKDLEHDPFNFGTLGYVYAKWGKKREAQQILDELKERSKSSYIPPDPFWRIYVGLGEKDPAFEWLLKGCHTAESGDGNIKVDPMFDDLRSDPRFADVLRCAGFTP